VPLILSIETATLGGSVSLSRGNELLTTISGDNQVSHSNTLLLEINKLLIQTGCELQDIDLYAVASGPGSFTGLRIGIATVKALASTLERPCIGVPTLDAVAYSARSCERIVAVLPAGRGEVFVQMFEGSLEDVVPLDTATHIPPLEMLEKYSQFTNICWCGEGAQLYGDKITAAAGNNERQISESRAKPRIDWKILPKTTPLAENVAALAYKRAKANNFQTPEALSAIYVRPSDAELKVKPTE
jgi:tRNA threonylcarbamoyladenosine biosynthesis protein TsaB